MTITMVKKRLPDGSECRKCQQATRMLQQRGYWDRITKVVYVVDPDNPDDEGSRLAKEHRVSKTPFFIVERDGEAPHIYHSVLKLMRDVLAG